MSTIDTGPRFYTVAQVCEMLQISRTTLYRVTKRGDLYALRVGTALRYPGEAIAAYSAGEPYDPEGGTYLARPDVATWPPTPSLLDPEDKGPHSRACGWEPHEHGTRCSSNCPTCHGQA